MRDLGVATWAFSRVAGRVTGTEPPAIFTVLGRNRPLFRGWLHFAAKLMPGGKLPRRETELVILRVAHLAGSDYEWTHHARLARRAGLTTEDVGRVRLGPSEDGWSKPDQLLLAATDELYRAEDLTAETWAALREVMDEATCIELLMLVGHYRMLATTLRVLRVEPDRVSRRESAGG